MPDADRIVERFFVESEVRGYRRLPPAERRIAFFTIWTRKEALMKADGLGLTKSMGRHEVSIDRPARILNLKHDEELKRRWSLSDLRPPTGYLAALAVEGHDWRASCLEWPESEEWIWRS